MSANLFFIIHPNIHTPRCEGARAFFLPLLLVFGVLLMPGSGFAQTSTLTVVDNEPVDIAPGEPGPGDNMVFSVRRNATYVVSFAFTTGQPGEIVTHRMSPSGNLTPVGRTPAGPEPRQIAQARNGDYAVLVNSNVNQVAVMSLGDDGLLREVSRTSSGGVNPYDVAVGFNDIVVVTNRDSNQINTFHVDRRGRLTPLDVAVTGLDPHVVSVSSRGFVAVANQTERSVSLFDLNRWGELTKRGPNIPTDNMVPRALAWHGSNLYVALDAPGSLEDTIRIFRVIRRVEASPSSTALRTSTDSIEIEQGPDIPAGHFLTDIEAARGRLFAATVNINTPTTPADDRDEIRVYQINGTNLIPDASVQTDNFPPSFKQLSTFRGRGGKRHVIVSEFQSGWVRSLLYDPRPQDDDEEEDDEDDE